LYFGGSENNASIHSRYLFRTDAQRCQVAMGGDVIQCFLMQIICIQEDLQAGELLGE